jgi:hypothetical protein
LLPFSNMSNLSFCPLGLSETAKQARVSRQTVYRIQADLAGAEAALMRWRE